VYNEDDDELVIFAVNKDLKEDITLSMDLRQFAAFRVIEHVTMQDEDLYAVNTEADPNRIFPANCTESGVENNSLKAVLKHKSWNMIRLGRG
jgi:alpha-N-arabinofuranosidase